MTKKELSQPTIYYIKKDGKPVVHAVELCCCELQDRYHEGVVEFVSQYTKGHEHLGQLDNIPELSAILWYPDKNQTTGKEYLYINNCMMCGKPFQFKESEK